jgi:dolichol kinase
LPAEHLTHLDQAATIDYRNELVRKAIHLFSISVPIVYFFIPRWLALCLVLPVTAAFVTIDLARYRIPAVSQWFYRWFGWLLRRHEIDSSRRRLNGASNVLISASLCVLLFPKIVAINAFAILIISDTTSALIGRRFGRHRFFGKSLEGSAAFFISAVAVVFLTPKASSLAFEYFIGILAAAVGTVVEALPVRIDDNLSIPIGIGFTLWGLYAWLLPALDISRVV